MKKKLTFTFLMTLTFVLSCSELADSIQEVEALPEEAGELEFRATKSYPWQDHAFPFDFLFGNHIDSHQQTKTVGRGNIQGYFYITFNGKYTSDGVPQAMHGNCNMHPGTCTVGWKLFGVPVKATLVAHGEGQHPTWCIDPDDMPNDPGYTHFHWTGTPEHAGDITIGDTRDGYLLKLTAIETFFFEHHGGFLVRPGVDYVTHANVVEGCD